MEKSKLNLIFKNFIPEVITQIYEYYTLGTNSTKDISMYNLKIFEDTKDIINWSAICIKFYPLSRTKNVSITEEITIKNIFTNLSHNENIQLNPIHICLPFIIFQILPFNFINGVDETQMTEVKQMYKNINDITHFEINSNDYDTKIKIVKIKFIKNNSIYYYFILFFDDIHYFQDYDIIDLTGEDTFDVFIWEEYQKTIKESTEMKTTMTIEYEFM